MARLIQLAAFTALQQSKRDYGEAAMKPILTITFCALMLAGCAQGYDPAAVQSATVTMQISSERCEARRTVNDLKTYSEWEACELAAERAFAIAINLKKMDAFEAYAANMQALAARRDANRVTAQQVKLQAEVIRSAFLANCNCKSKIAYRYTYMPGVPDMYMPGPPGNAYSGVDMGMGQGNHAMGPGPGNFGN